MDVVLAAGGAPWEAAAIAEIEASASLRLARRCVDVPDLLAIGQTGLASAAFVNIDLAGFDADVVYRLERAGIRVAAVAADPQRCGGLGIDRIVGLGSLEVIVDDTASPLPETGSATAGKIVAVWGPLGAPGRSTVALALASARAAAGVDTVVVDGDTYGGSLSQMLAVLDDVSGLMASCRSANNGHAGDVTEHLLTVEPNLRLLTGLPRADMWPQIRAGALDLVLRQLRSSAELTVVDCGFSLEPGGGPGANSRNQATLLALECADVVVAVGRADPVGLARLVRGLHDLAEILPGHSPDVVVNMMRSSLGWNERDVESTLSRLTGMTPAAFLPFDPAGIDAALMSGISPRLAAPGSSFVARIAALAADLDSHCVAPPLAS